MKKLICFIVFVFLFNVCLKSDVLPPEETILEGLSKKKVAERIPFVKASVFYSSKKIFQKLAQLYSTDNKIKSLVFASLLKMNKRSDGLFSDDFAQVIFDEFERLKKIDRPNIHVSYLEDMFSRMLFNPEYNYNRLLNLIESNKNNIVDSISDVARKEAFEKRFALTKQVIKDFCEKSISSDLKELITARDFFKSPFVTSNIEAIARVFWQCKCPVFFSSFFASKIYADEEFSLYLLNQIASQGADVGVTAPIDFQNTVGKMRQQLDREIDQFGKELFSNE